ncbi:MAG: DUF2007 domain-containing protein [Flavobacteriaceae bacterium]
MINKDFIMIYEGSIINTNRLNHTLRENNISPIIKCESESARLAGFGIINGTKTRVFVHKDQIKHTRKIMKNLGI